MTEAACAVDTFRQADLYGREKLKLASLEYIRMNTAKIFQSDEWKLLKDENPSLYLEALEYCIPKI